jgi:Kef-type K+ transport system membrane component KefB
VSDAQLLQTLLQIAVILGAARIGGEVAVRLNVPQVVGELAGGIALGPSVLGALFPGVFRLLFPSGDAQLNLLELLSWLGVTFLVLIAGLETRLGMLRGSGRAVVGSWIGGFWLPFVVGTGAGWLLPVGFWGPQADRLSFALFVATAMSISAIPVIARILLDLGVMRTRMGMVIMSSALADDTVGWIVLAVTIGLATAGGIDGTLLGVALGGTALFLVLAATLGQYGVRKLLRFARNMKAPHAQGTAMFLLVLAGGALTQALHVHMVLGSFVTAILIARSCGKDAEAIRSIRHVGMSLFIPFFFGYAGSKVDLTTLDGSAFGVAIAILVLACLSKLVGGGLGALAGGLRGWEAAAVGAGLNARGAMELVIAAIGLSAGIVDLRMYSIIVLVAIVTTLMAAPLLRYCLARIPTEVTPQLGSKPAVEAAV